MNVEVVLLPGQLGNRHVEGRAVVVFDVLRATTSMTAALAVGVREIRIFDSIEAVREAGGACEGERLLCGERGCLRPEGFDLGNSPGAFGPTHAGRVMFMSTTNGTKAIAAARGGERLAVGALVNASAVARWVRSTARPATLLCAGTDGKVAMEDVLGAGAVMEVLGSPAASDVARMAVRLYRAEQGRLGEALREAQGGRNLLGVGLGEDIDFAARVDALDVVGEVTEGAVRVAAG